MGYWSTAVNGDFTYDIAVPRNKEYFVFGVSKFRHFHGRNRNLRFGGSRAGRGAGPTAFPSTIKIHSFYCRACRKLVKWKMFKKSESYFATFHGNEMKRIIFDPEHGCVRLETPLWPFLKFTQISNSPFIILTYLCVDFKIVFTNFQWGVPSKMPSRLFKRLLRPPHLQWSSNCGLFVRAMLDLALTTSFSSTWFPNNYFPYPRL